MTDIHGLMQVGKFASLAQAVEELTEILLHLGPPGEQRALNHAHFCHRPLQAGDPVTRSAEVSVRAFPKAHGVLDRPVKPGDDATQCPTINATLPSARDRGNAPGGREVSGLCMGAIRLTTQIAVAYAPRDDKNIGS
jgi:hypothetical protein